MANANPSGMPLPRTPRPTVPPRSAADRAAFEAASHVRTVRINMADPDGTAIHRVLNEGGRLELHDSTRRDVTPIVLDDFLMSVMRGEVA